MKTRLKEVALLFVALSISFLGQADLNATLIDSLSGYWHMDDSPVDMNNTTIVATAGSDATLVDNEAGDRGVTGKIDDAIKFWKPGGHQAYADMGSGYAIGTGSYSVNFWWNAAGSTGGLMNNGNWGSVVNGLSLHLIGSRNIFARFNDGTNQSDIAVVTGAALGSWNMLTLTVDRGTDTISLHHNGGAASGSESIAGYGNLDGAGNANSKTYFASVVNENTGMAASPSFTTLDEIAIWDRALTTAEISDLYNDGNGLAIVPEPSSVVLMGLASLVVMANRKRRK